MSQQPVSLNPRGAQDAAGQRIGALLFRGLTRINADLQAEPDLATDWSVSRDGKTWTFTIKPSVDQGGEPIDANRMANCLEQYRIGKPSSPLRTGFPHWKSTRADGSRVLIELTHSDPFLARNVSLLRYFRAEIPGAEPCADLPSQALGIGSGAYRMARWTMAPEGVLDLISMAPDSPSIHFDFIRDDTTLALKLLRGDSDITQNSLSLAKTRWLSREHGARFTVIERDGVNVSYLAFNLRDPVLAKLPVRQAIAMAIPREEIVKNKLFGFCKLADTLLSPLLPGSHGTPLAYNPALSEKVLDGAGYPRGADGVRLRFRYKTTPARDGIELALMMQDGLKKIGIALDLDVVEPAVFQSSVRKGAYQLHSSRWIGVADASILYRTLHSKQSNNRWGYKSAEMDALLDRAMAEGDDRKRAALFKSVQTKAAEDLPFVPLWYWNNALIVRKDLEAEGRRVKISLSGALEPLTVIKLSP